jgi:hypothetical protein
MDNALPKRAKDRTENELPTCSMSMIEIMDPICSMPQILAELPSLIKLRMLKPELAWTKSKTEIADPILAKP